MMIQANVPMPLQVVLDDVGWWCGQDGHERQQPYRTGIQRNHVPADYQAIVSLGRQLNMRPQAAMILCEWDRENILRECPSCTWMGKDWDNRRWVGGWMEETADIMRSNREHFEITLHGIGHEYWSDGVMSRAEWHDREGRMRPREEIQKRIELFARILDQHQLGPFPESFVPCAFLHRFGAGGGGIMPLLRNAGIRYVSTPFHRMKRDAPPQKEFFGVDEGLVVVDREQDRARPWSVIGCEPAMEVTGPICGLHWPNILHGDPARNEEVVRRWVKFLKPHGDRFNRVLSRDTASCWTQLVYHECTKVTIGDRGIMLDWSEINDLSPVHLEDQFMLKIRGVEGLRISCSEAEIFSLEQDRNACHIMRICPRIGASIAHLALEQT